MTESKGNRCISPHCLPYKENLLYFLHGSCGSSLLLPFGLFHGTSPGIKKKKNISVENQKYESYAIYIILTFFSKRSTFFKPSRWTMSSEIRNVFLYGDEEKNLKELCIIQVYDVFGYPTIQQQW